MAEPQEIRSLLAPMPGAGVLLPGSVVAEVISFSEPEPYRQAPPWLLGELRWNAWTIPLVNLSLLAGVSDDEMLPERSRVLVVKTLADSSSVMHVGIVINGLPRLKRVSAADLVETRRLDVPGVFSEVSLDDQAALIPDLEQLAETIEQAVYRH
jgi:chemosensory pili system protein ChpC